MLIISRCCALFRILLPTFCLLFRLSEMKWRIVVSVVAPMGFGPATFGL